MDSRGNWFRSGFKRLGKTFQWGITFYKICFGLFCCLWWHCFRKYYRKLLFWSLITRSKMLLWILDRYGKHSFRNIFSSYWYIHQRQFRKKITFWSSSTLLGNQWQSLMGIELDDKRKTFCLKNSSFCCSGRNFLFWFILCYILAQEMIIVIRLNIFKWAYF